jgi:error-prone DNA polymerase
MQGCSRYAELHCTTNFSFLQGGSHPEELVSQAASLGYAALAITDRVSLSGVVRAHAAAKEAGVHLIIGAVVEPIDATPLVLWVTNKKGYENLCRLLTTGLLKQDCLKGYGEIDGNGLRDHDPRCFLTADEVATHADGLLAGIPLSQLRGSVESATVSIRAWQDRLGKQLYGLAEVAMEGDDQERLAEYASLSYKTHIPLVAAGDVRYHCRDRQPLHDALAAVRYGRTVESIQKKLLSNGERHLQDIKHVVERFSILPGAVDRTLEIASRCTFSLDDISYEYPHAVVPAGCTPIDYLSDLARKGARKRYGNKVPEKVAGLLKHELSLVRELGYEAYFLTVFDLVRFARRRGILCQGRGSAANSAICYCLGITSVDPARTNVLFERFVSRERQEAPDIDVDFEHHRREEVLQYIYTTYGRMRSAMTAEVICYRLRSAVRDLAKVLGFSLDRIDQLSRILDVGDRAEQLPKRLAESGIDPCSESGRRLVVLVNQLVSFPRHLGQHVGGMVITRGDLCELVPIQPASMDGRTVIQWDKNDLDEIGILKVDCLSLGMLSAIRRAFDLVKQGGGPCLTLGTVPAEDPRVYEMISQADTVGVFQIESRAQRSMLPRLKPACFYDLVIEVAIVRPGPIQGGMVHPYLRRRQGEESVSYPNQAIREVLEKTLGVPLFQEQAMRLAVVAAGFTPGEADQLRRAMGAWRRTGVIQEFHQRLVDGMVSRGLSLTFAEQVFQQLRGFGEYGFPESHAASFALLVYVSAWLKFHYPAEFTAALLGSQPMGFYAPAQLVRDAQEHGVTVLPVCIQSSGWHAGLETSGGTFPALRLGLEQVHGLGQASGRQIEEVRNAGRFKSIYDLTRRCQLTQPQVLSLARAGALKSLSGSRRQAIWNSMERKPEPGSMPLFEGLAGNGFNETESIFDETGGLPTTSPLEEVLSDYRASGLSLKAHPLQFVRPHLIQHGVVTAAGACSCPEGRRVVVVGIVLSRQRPATAKGTIFLTLEDETDIVNVVVPKAVWQHCDPKNRRATVLMVKGRIQRRGNVVHLLARRLEAWGEDDANELSLVDLPRMSRDFC